MLGLSAVAETPIAAVPGAGAPPDEPPPIGAPWANLWVPIDYLALVHADDDDALLTAL